MAVLSPIIPGLAWEGRQLVGLWTWTRTISNSLHFCLYFLCSISVQCSDFICRSPAVCNLLIIYTGNRMKKFACRIQLLPSHSLRPLSRHMSCVTIQDYELCTYSRVFSLYRQMKTSKIILFVQKNIFHLPAHLFWHLL